MKLQLALSTALLVAVSSLSACGSDADAAAKEKAKAEHPDWAKLTFTVGEQSDGIVGLAEESGAFDGAPYEVKWAKFDYGPPLVPAASAGQIDLGNVGAVPPITGAAKDLGFKIVATQSPLHPEDSIEDLIVPKGSPIKELEDLEGKRIAVPQGSSAHGLVLNALASVDLTPDDVELVYLPPAEGAAAFDSGKVDAWSIWDPQASVAVDKGARVLAEGVPPLDYGTGFYVASDATLEDPVRRAALTDLLQRIAEAYQYGNDNLDAWAKLYAKETGLPLDQVEELLPGWRRKLTFVTDEQKKAEQVLATNFLKAGEIDQEVDVEQVVDNVLPEGYDVG